MLTKLMKRSMYRYLLIIVIEIELSYVLSDSCSKEKFEVFDDYYIYKDVDMCTMFMQSYSDSISMNMSVVDYLLKYIHHSYINDGHLRIFSEYSNNYSFILATTVDQIQNNDHNKKKYQRKMSNEFKNDESVEWEYKSINWNQSYDQLFTDISEKFQISEDCSSSITLYLTFASYPQNNLLLKFLKNFQSSSNIPPISNVLNDDKNFYYRNNIDVSFLSLIDGLPLPIFQQFLRQYANVRLVLCGHGLGGTIAQLSTLHLLSTGFNVHHSKFRSISLGSLFFGKENTVKFIKEHHFDHHFINIYHEMDLIPSLFNVASVLSKIILSNSEEKQSTTVSKMFDAVKSFVFSKDDPIEKYRFYLKHILTSLCKTITTHYSTLSPQLCKSLYVDNTINFLKESLKYAKDLLKKDQIFKLIYQPIGIFNLITYQKYDETWHLINVINTSALYDHLNGTLEQLTKSERIYQIHSISNYIMVLQQCNKQKFTSVNIQPLLNLIKSVAQNNYTDDINHMSNSNININSSIVIPLPFRFSDHLYTGFRSGTSYMNMIAIPPILPFDNSTILNSQFSYLKRKFLSAIKHRTDIFRMNLNKKPPNEISMYDICLSIYETYGIDARMELIKLQLDQRMLVPILISTNKILSSSSTSDTPRFRSYIKTLSLVETAVLQSQDNILAKDFKLLRIGLISTIQGRIGGLPDFIKNIFQVSSIRQFTPGMGTSIKPKTIAEIGYGFLPDINSPLSYRPVILVHIIGDYRPLISFLVQYIDTLIVEYNEHDSIFNKFDYDQLFQSLRIQRIMKWKHTTDVVFNEVISFQEPYMMDEFEGSITAVTSAFQTHLLELASDSDSYLHSATLSDTLKVLIRPRLIDLIKDKELLIDDNIPLLDTEKLFKNIKISELKKEEFKLQHSYKKEAESRLEMDNPTLQLNNVRIKELEDNIRQERNYRSNIYKIVEEIPLLKSYIYLLSEPNEEKRYIQKRQFEFSLEEHNEASISVIRKKKDQLFNEMKEAEKAILISRKDPKILPYLKEKEEKSIKKYYQAKKDFIDTSLVIDHFWREISHLYLVNQTEYQHFPHLAAQHLIDGFSLELLDGDSMLLNIQWIEQVFISLDKILYEELDRTARILVLSICGSQSSGKSFLLKTMYGVRVRSSVGACTQGVNMMLVKVFYQYYDYILLLDTEGLRAPEFNGMKDAEMRDNILASFSVLPADGTILLNKGEINQALEDILPIVLYLYATSSLAKQLGGQIPSKLFFVYNQIDPGQPQKGMELLQDLTTRLQNVTHQIIQAVSTEGIPFYGFEQCRLDLKNLSNSDFRILSNNMNNPPINHPISLFGEQSLYLREWIDRRITNISGSPRWQPRSIINMIDYLKIVSNMVRRAPHITSVSTSLEIFENNKLNTEIENIKHNFSSISHQIRSEVENEIISIYINSSDIYNYTIISWNQFENITDYANTILSRKMNNIILETQEEIFNLVKGTKRQLYHEEDWVNFLKDKEKRNKKILTIKIVREITNFDFYDKTQAKIRADFITKCDEINCTDLNLNEQKQIFNDILKKRTKEIEESDRFGFINVTYEIKTVYNNSAIIKDIKIFNQNNFCHPNGSLIKLFNDENLLKNFQNNQSDEQIEQYHHRLIQENRNVNQIIDQIKSFIEILINSETRYESLIVNNVLQRIQKIIKERSIISLDMIKDVHQETFCFLEYKLIKLQNEWDSMYNRTKRLEENKEKLWKFFQNIVQGVRGIQLFQLTIYNEIKNSWHNGFIEYLIQDVATEVSKERWIGNSDILQAKLDQIKIEILKKSNITILLDEISSANIFYEKSVLNFVQIHVNNYIQNEWIKFYNDIMDTITRAGNDAKLASNNRLNIFLNRLHDQTLPFSIRSRLPTTASTYGSADSQSTDIFDSIIKKLRSAIPETPQLLLNGNESEQILNRIREYGATESTKPRCNHACRLCGAPCFKHSGHSGHHDFHHQPSGLVGRRWMHSDHIVHDTCHDLFMKNASFTFNAEKGPFHPYAQFPKILDYEVPASESQRSLLGEYLMSKYHKEIAEYYKIQPNPSIPIKYYEHTLENIENDIKRRLGSNQDN